MLIYLIKQYNKIVIKFNKLLFLSNKNIKVGRNFKLSNFTTSLIHHNSRSIIGNDVEIRNNFNLVMGEKSKLIIGDEVFFNNFCSINCLENIMIGNRTLFGEGVKLYDHNHLYGPDFINHKEFSTKSIKIGDNCWLGSNVTILKGVEIGDNVIIGAGCVIHKNIESNTIVLNNQQFIIKDKK